MSEFFRLCTRFGSANSGRFHRLRRDRPRFPGSYLSLRALTTLASSVLLQLAREMLGGNENEIGIIQTRGANAARGRRDADAGSADEGKRARLGSPRQRPSLRLVPSGGRRRQLV